MAEPSGGHLLEGLFLPVTTPFDAAGEVDEEAFRANLRGWLAHPVAGLVIGGSTGEAPLLEEEELFRLLRWAREEASDRLLVAGTGAESTRATVRAGREAAEHGADAVLVRPPSYYRDAMTPAALRAHYHAVADASPVPVILYHIPRYVPVELRPELVRGLVRHGNVAGIKDSSGDIRNLGALVEGCGDEARVLVGSGSLLYAALEIGAAGGIVAVGLLVPGIACEILEAWRAGRTAEAGRLQERVDALNRTVVGGLGVPGVKAALEELGLSGGDPRPPLLPLEERGRRAVRGALRAAGAAA